MPSILTVTLNPSIDAWSEADEVHPIHKIRTGVQRFDPGGGGINVARVIHKFGDDVEALYLAGGATGTLLGELLAEEGIRTQLVGTNGATRIAFNIFERKTRNDYRFVPEGAAVSNSEVEACLARVHAFKGDFVVVSGSVPNGAPETILREMGDIVKAKNARFIVDSSGPALRHALSGGGVYLVKPSLGELSQIAGRKLDKAEAAQTAEAIVSEGACEMVAVTLGADGAILITPDSTLHVPAIPVEAHSAVGAGDSFLGAMVWALSEGWERRKAFRLGVAAGAATALSPGTALCDKNDVLRLFEAASSGV